MLSKIVFLSDVERTVVSSEYDSPSSETKTDSHLNPTQTMLSEILTMTALFFGVYLKHQYSCGL